MPPQTRSKIQIQPLYTGSVMISGGDMFEDSTPLHTKGDVADWDKRLGAPIRPPLPKRNYVNQAIQTSPIEEHPPFTPPALCHDLSSSNSTPDPDSDGDDTYAAKSGLKRKKSVTQSNGPQVTKKIRSSASPPSQVKLVTAPKQARRETVLALEGAAPKRSIYAPSPTPLQCNYVYPIALGPPRRPIDLRRTKGAKAMPDASVPAAAAPTSQALAPATDSTAPNTAAPGEPIPMEVDDSHKHTHRCPITFSREFEMRRHIRTVHIAEEIRAVVEGRLPRAEATVIPDNWDGKTLLTKPTCSGCGTTFSRPDAVRRHQTEVNAKMENGICIECPGPKVHIRRGPRKDVHHPGQSPVPPLAHTTPLAVPATAISVPTPDHTNLSAPAVVTTPAADAPNTPVALTSTSPQPQPVVRERAEPTEGELESEDDM